MGIRDNRASGMRWLLLVFVGLTACETKRNDRVISSLEFEAPELQNIRVVASKLDLQRAISPNALASVLLSSRVRAVPLGKVAREDLLVYEANVGAITSVDLCVDCSPGVRSQVTMHWDQRGLEDELRNNWGVVIQNPTVSFETRDLSSQVPTTQGVVPIALRGAGFQGWVLAFEPVSGSVIAFRKNPAFRIVPSSLNDPELSVNFGSGNGLLMAVVVSGRQIEQQLDEAAVRVSRLVELENGKILVFSSLRQVHMLELTLEPRSLDFNLDFDDDPLVAVPVPVGRFRGDRGDPERFLSYDTIQTQVTQNRNIDLDSFQPIYISRSGRDFCGEGTGLPIGGRLLVYDAGSFSFLRIWEETDETSARFGKGNVDLAIGRAELIDAFDGRLPPYFMSQGAYDPDCRRVLIFEELTSTLFAYNLFEPGLDVTSSPLDFFLRRDPAVVGGSDDVPSSKEPVLRAAENNIRGQRLYFDQGQDQVISVHFDTDIHVDTSNVVVVADGDDFATFTVPGFQPGISLAPAIDITWFEALSSPSEQGETLRAFDSETASLLEIHLEYIALPAVDAENTR